MHGAHPASKKKQNTYAQKYQSNFSHINTTMYIFHHTEFGNQQQLF